MGVKSWLVRHRLLSELQVWKVKVDAERAALEAGKENKNMPQWLHAVLVVFAGGAITALTDALTSTNGFTADAAGFKRVALAGLVGGLIAIVAWLKQSPIKPAAVLLLCVLVGTTACGQLQLETFPKRPLGVDQGVVEGLVCRGELKQAEVYAQDRGASRAEVTERVQRAVETVAHKPGCCAGPTCSAQGGK